MADLWLRSGLHHLPPLAWSRQRPVPRGRHSRCACTPQRQHGAEGSAPERQRGAADEVESDDASQQAGADIATAPALSVTTLDCSGEQSRQAEPHLSAAHLMLLRSAGFQDAGEAARAAEQFPQLLGAAPRRLHMTLPVQALLARGIRVHGALRMVTGSTDNPAAVRPPSPVSPLHVRQQREAEPPVLLIARGLEQGAGAAGVGCQLLPVVSELHAMGVSLEALASVVRDAPAALGPGSELPAVVAWLYARGVGVPANNMPVGVRDRGGLQLPTCFVSAITGIRSRLLPGASL